MKNTIRVLTVSAVMAMSAVAFANSDSSGASNSASASSIANINQGDIGLGGAFGWTQVEGVGNFLSLSAPIQYFIMDHLSVGGEMNLSRSNVGPSWSAGVGPAATYYFWTQDKMAAYGSEALTYQYTSSQNGAQVNPAWRSTTSLGMNYFLAPTLALGPALEYSHRWNGSSTSNRNVVAMTGNFKLYF